MAKDPAFLFYSSDFLVGTFDMTDEQVGQYIRLMCLQHQKGHLSERIVHSVTGGTADPGVLCKFEQDENGLYYNPRLESEITKRAEYSESRRKNRAGNSNTSASYVNHMHNTCSTYDPHMENENEDVNKDRDVTNEPKKQEPYSLLFDTFWAAYPKKAGKADALKAFSKLKPDNILMQTILTALEKYSKTEQWTKDGGKYVPLPATYIRGRRWEDELPKDQQAQPERKIKMLN